MIQEDTEIECAARKPDVSGVRALSSGGKNLSGGRDSWPARRSPKWIDWLLAGLAVGVCLGTGNAAPAPEGNADPSDHYLQVLVAVDAAVAVAETGERDTALRQLEAATAQLKELRVSHPDWNPGMVDYRLRTTAAEIERIRLGVVPPRAALPESGGAKGKATAAEASPSSDPMGKAASPGAIPRALEVQPPALMPAVDAQATLRPLGKDADGRPTGIRVLVLSDSMGIGGFAEKLDDCFRAMPGVEGVYTYMACGTNPLTWMKPAPYAGATTRCGYFSIESVRGQPKPLVIRDVYGVPAGHKPGRHRVPKIEDLVARIQPHIVVFQNGNNFFSGFKDRKTINPKSRGPMIRAHVAPFVRWLAENGSSIRKLYWVSPPATGNVTAEIQQFVFDVIAEEMEGVGIMLDSREMTSYPYKVQAPDKEHFWGNESIAWGADTFAAIQRDLEEQSLLASPTLSRRGAVAASEPIGDVSAKAVIRIRARLQAKTGPPPPSSFAPYGEFLVGYSYEIVSVLAGSFAGDRVLVFHPAYIGRELQDLSGFEVGQSYDLEVFALTEASPWATVGNADTAGDFEMVPHMLTTDVDRHPDASKDSGCCP